MRGEGGAERGAGMSEGGGGCRAWLASRGSSWRLHLGVLAGGCISGCWLELWVIAGGYSGLSGLGVWLDLWVVAGGYSVSSFSTPSSEGEDPMWDLAGCSHV